PAAALLAVLSTHAATAAPAGLAASVTVSALAQPAAGPSLPGLVKGALILMAWNKAKISGTAIIIVLLLGGGGLAVRQWQARSAATATVRPASARAIVHTFEPM